MKIIPTISFLLFTVFFINGCSGSKQKTPEFDSAKWNLETLNGSKVVFGGEKSMTLEINASEFSASGKAPCNSFSCNYKQSGDLLSFSPIMSTKMACEQLAVENEYFEMLSRVNKYKILGNRLMLYSEGTVVAEYIKAP